MSAQTIGILIGVGLFVCVVGFVAVVKASLIASGEADDQTEEEVRQRTEEIPVEEIRRNAALISRGPVPDGVDEDAKARERERCDGSWSCPAAAHVRGCFATQYDSPAANALRSRRGRGVR